MLTNEDNSACAFEILHSGMVPNILRYAHLSFRNNTAVFTILMPGTAYIVLTL